MQDKVIVWGGIGEKKSNGGTQWYLQNRIFNADGISPSLTSIGGYWIIIFDDD